MINLLISEVTDKWTKENFKRLQDFIRKEPIFRGDFSFYEFTSMGAGTVLKPHGLSFTPKDVIQLSVSDGQTVIWNYDDFSATLVSFSTSGACTVRAYIGRHREGS